MHDDTAEQKINFLAKQTSRALTYLQDQEDSNKTADNNLLDFLPFFMVYVVSSLAICTKEEKLIWSDLFGAWGLNPENL